MARVDLFSTSQTPYKGLKSDRHPLALKPGEAFDAKNLRADPGRAVRVRDGIAQEINTAGLPVNAVFWGASEMVRVQQGFWLIYAAIEDPATAKIDVYNRQYTSASGWGAQWHRLTGPSGAFGDTRLSRPMEGLVTFTGVDSDPRAREHLTYVGPTASKGPAVIVQNGVDRPLHVVGYPDASATDSRAVPIKKIATPVAARAAVAEAGVFDSLPVASGAVTVGANAGGTFTAPLGGSVARVGAAGDYSWEWKTGTSLSVGDYGQVVMDTESMSAFGGALPRSVPQVGFVVEAGDGSWWDCVKVWANVSYDGGAYGWELIHDPNAAPGSSKNNRVHVLTNAAGFVVSAYSFDDKSQGGYTLVNVNGIKIEVDSARLSTSSTFRVHWVYASGWVPGAAQYAVARKAALSESESGGVLLAQGAFGKTTTALREPWTNAGDGTALDTANARFRHPMVQGGSLPPDFVFPVDPRLFYHYRVPVVNPWMSEVTGAFADTWSVYRKDPGDAEFYHAADVQVATYSAIGQAWALALNPAEGALFAMDDTVPPEDKDYRRRAPDTYNEPTPVGASAVFTNKRHFVGVAVKDAQGNNVVGNSVFVSEEGYAGRFRAFGRFDSPEGDPSSGYEVRLGVEDVKALVAADGPRTNAAVSSVFCLTDRSLYSIDRVLDGKRLFNVRRIASIGTQTRHTAVGAGGLLLWIDGSRALRSSARSLPDLSGSQVQGRLDSVADADWHMVQAARFKGRLYIARKERVLTYLDEMWESDDELPVAKAVAQFLKFQVGGASRLLYFAVDAKLYEYERKGQVSDDGAPIAFALESREFHHHSFEPVAAHRVGVVGTTAQAVLTTKRVFSEPPATIVGTLDLQDGTSRAWKYDRTAAGGVPGGEGQSVRVRVEGSFDEPFEMIALVAEIEGTDLGGARV